MVLKKPRKSGFKKKMKQWIYAMVLFKQNVFPTCTFLIANEETEI